MNKINFWGIACLVFIISIYLTSDILAPFLISFIFAYLLQPLIDNNCHRFGFSRSKVALYVFVFFLSILVTIAVLLLPVIYQQIEIFIDKAPQYKSNFEAGILELSGRLTGNNSDIAIKLSNSMQNFINSAFSFFSSFANHIWEYTLATINFFVIVALVPIILYYFLRDWPQIVTSIESVLPLRGKSKLREILYQSTNFLQPISVVS